MSDPRFGTPSPYRNPVPAPNPNTPAINQPLADIQSLTMVCDQLKQAVDSLIGARGLAGSRAVTFEDLQKLGLLASPTQAGVTSISTLKDETAARTSADTTLQTNIDNEASTRAAADTTLQTNINNEASTRATNDTTLQTNINTETTARINGDAKTFVANGTVAVTITSLGPVGAHTTVQKWLIVNDGTGDLYVPCY